MPGCPLQGVAGVGTKPGQELTNLKPRAHTSRAANTRTNSAPCCCVLSGPHLRHGATLKEAWHMLPSPAKVRLPARAKICRGRPEGAG